MDIFEKCKQISNNIESDIETKHYETNVSLSNSTNKKTTLPVVSLTKGVDNMKLFCRRVLYISDIHLVHKVVKKFKEHATDEQIEQYIKGIADNLITPEFLGKWPWETPIVLFGGDVSSCFELSKIFFKEFMERWNKEEEAQSVILGEKKRECCVYAVLGNHEFWDFKTIDECNDAYSQLFKSLGICFLNNKARWFYAHYVPKRFIKDKKGNIVRTEVLKEEDDEVEYQLQMRHIHNIIIVGGVGFAGKNCEFNADKNIYRKTLDREQEIEETNKWNDIYNYALDVARETNSVLISLTHNPISDWKDNGNPDVGCVYFTGHTHRNFLYQDDEANIHIFANNQIGYKDPYVSFKEALIYKRFNPFAIYNDGYYEVNSKDYLMFNDYVGLYIEGNKIVDNLIENYDAKFYMIKHSGYYGFFVVRPRCTYICAGGRVKKISKDSDIKQFYDNFSDMVEKYKKVLSPYRNAQEQISKEIRSIGGEGYIHGCIVDVDYFNHIMISPYDGTISYYYSSSFGFVQVYDNLISLLENHNEALAVQYKKQIKSDKNMAISSKQLSVVSDVIKVNIKDSIYAVSNRMNQLQRLFDKNILRDWNEDLLYDERV